MPKGVYMPKGPRGEKRPADTVSAAVMVGRIATGDATETLGKAPNRAKGGIQGGKRRAEALTSEQKAEIARIAANKRWKSTD
jgi:hypothetical protein